MFEKVGEGILLWRVLILLWDKWPKCLSEKRNLGLQEFKMKEDRVSSLVKI